MAQKNWISWAREADYGVAPSTGWNGARIQDLGGHTPIVPVQQPELMMYGQQGIPVEGARTSVTGGTGAIKPYLESAGLLLLDMLELTFGAPTVTELATGEAWERVYATGTIPDLSVAVQVGREFQAGGQDRDTFVGGQVEKWTFAQGMAAAQSGVSDEGLAKNQFDLQYRTMLDVAQHLPNYGTAAPMYSGSDWTLELGPADGALSADCLDGFNLEFMPGLDFENARCASSELRDLAGPGALPSAKITFPRSYKDRTYYDAWLAGTVMKLRSTHEITSVWLDGDETIHPKFQIDIAALTFSGEAPTESKDSATKQNLTSDARWNGTDDMVVVTVVSADEPA